MIVAPNRRDPLIGDNKAPTSRFAEYLERNAEDVNTNTDDVSTLETDVDALEADVATLNAIGEEFTATNVITTKTFDADTVTLAELADVMGSIIQRLQE